MKYAEHSGVVYFFHFVLFHISSQNSKLVVKAEIWYINLFEYAKFYGDVHYVFVPGKIWSKKSVLFNLQLSGTLTNSNMQNSMMMSILFVLERTQPFWTNLVQKIRTVSLSWNLVPRLIRICRMQWCCSLFLFSIGNSLFGYILFKKSKLAV